MKTPRQTQALDVRSVPGEVRMTTSTAGKRTIQGYAAVFNSRSQVLSAEADGDGDAGDGSGPDNFVEIVLPGAFTRSLAESDVRGLFNHDTRYLLGRRGAGTLRLAEDSTGLAYEIDLGTRSYDRDLEESLDRKDVFGSSFSFATVADDWSVQDDGMALRQLRAVHLFDVGPVVFPAYRAATATCRALSRYAVEARAAASAAAAAAPAVVYPTPDQVSLLNWFAIADL